MTEKPLLILDVDETLIHAATTRLDYAPDMVLAHYFVYFRPHVKRFLKDCGETFTLGVWSSATINYLTPIIRELWGDLPEPLFLWDRSRCTTRYDFHREEEYFVKDLRKVEANGRDLSRVLMVDDELRKVSFQYGNALCPRPFRGEVDDDELPRLFAYLQSIHAASDYRKIDKKDWWK